MSPKCIRRSRRLAAAGLFVIMLPGAGDVPDTAPATQFDARLLAAHNRERKSLGLSPLTWNAQLAEGARDWAKRLSSTGRFEHSPRGVRPLGENIWGGTPKAFAPEDMVGLWIAEKRHFQGGVFPANSRTGNAADVSHYTQVIWHSTSQVGCGLSRAGREEILVCRYSRPGNIVGRRPVLRTTVTMTEGAITGGQVVPS